MYNHPTIDIKINTTEKGIVVINGLNFFTLEFYTIEGKRKRNVWVYFKNIELGEWETLLTDDKEIVELFNLRLITLIKKTQGHMYMRYMGYIMNELQIMDTTFEEHKINGKYIHPHVVYHPNPFQD